MQNKELRPEIDVKQNADSRMRIYAEKMKEFMEKQKKEEKEEV